MNDFFTTDKKKKSTLANQLNQRNKPVSLLQLTSTQLNADKGYGSIFKQNLKP